MKTLKCHAELWSRGKESLLKIPGTSWYVYVPSHSPEAKVLVYEDGRTYRFKEWDWKRVGEVEL